MCKLAIKIIGSMIAFLAIIILISVVLKSVHSTWFQTNPQFPNSSTTSQNPSQFILSDPRVREGIAHCIDRESLVRIAYPWLRDASLLQMKSFLPQQHWAFITMDEYVEAISFNLAKGKALFEAAGWVLGSEDNIRKNAYGREMRLTLTGGTSESQRKLLADLADQLKSCGLQIEIKSIPNEVLYGNNSGIRVRDFELSVYPIQIEPGFDWLVSMTTCDHIPQVDNLWQGENYGGWCNPVIDNAIDTARKQPSQETQVAAYHAISAAMAQDLPGLPLFRTVEVFGTHPLLSHFAPDPGELSFIWNIGDWVIPGKDTIVIGRAAEPVNLYPLNDGAEEDLVRSLVFGQDYITRGYEYQPLLLKVVSSIENGRIQVNTVQAHTGDQVVDTNGNSVDLQPGVWVRNKDGKTILFNGHPVELIQFVVTYEFVQGLVWSDGTPVSRADYELAYRMLCKPDKVIANRYRSHPQCNRLENINFINDTAYRVTWKPGDWIDYPYSLPPLGRQPAHQRFSGDRRLSDLQPYEWDDPEIINRPLSTGPYVLAKWIPGDEIVFEANPLYFLGPPATPTIVIKFIALDNKQKTPIDLLSKREIDLFSWAGSIPDADMDTLLSAEAAGHVRLYPVPTSIFEWLNFAHASP